MKAFCPSLVALIVSPTSSSVHEPLLTAAFHLKGEVTEVGLDAVIGEKWEEVEEEGSVGEDEDVACVVAGDAAVVEVVVPAVPWAGTAVTEP